MMKTPVKICVSLVFALCAQALLAETVYKGTDAQGNPVFSDHPFPNSKAIEIAPVQTYSAPPVHANPAFKQTNSAQQTAITYKLSITKPQNEQTFPQANESIDVAVSVEPNLRDTDQIVLMLNGQPYGTYDSGSMTLKDLPRGAYQLKATVVSKAAKDKVLGESGIVTFFQQRTSIITSPAKN